MRSRIKIKETPLIEVKKLRKQFNLQEVFIKDESKNPFGTIKDVRNWFILEEANRLKVDKLVLITSGNNGYSLAQLMKGCSVKVVCVISNSLSQKTKKLLQKVAYKVIAINLNDRILHSEELIALARERNDEVIWDVTNGYEENYEKVMNEILEKVKPHYVVVPVGSGGIYLSMVQVIEKKSLPTKIIGMGVLNTSNSLADKLSTPWTPYVKALAHYHKMGHPIYRLNEAEIKRNYQEFKNIVDCEPSSSVIFAAAHKHLFKETDVVVFLNSGKMSC